MKKVLLILSIIQLIIANQILADDSTLVESNLVYNTNRNFYLNKQLEIYRFIPSDLWNWSNSDFSSIAVNGSLNNGDFKTVDDFDKNEQFSFKSESVQSFNKTGWRFYGNFTLDISNHEKADWNLGYVRSEIGNPYRLITKRTGDFNVKHYGLNGIMSKKLGEKISLASGIKYDGDLYFRLRDTRNEFYNLTIEFAGAINYAITKTKNISLGISYYYKKAAPDFSNEYMATEDEYFLYFNEGLGDFNKIELSDKFYLKNQNPKYYISYFSGKQNKFSLAYSAYLGNEHWDYKITSALTDTDKELYKYEYFSNELKTSYLIDKTNYKWFNLIEVKSISGTGYKNRGVFQKTYICDVLNLQATSELLQLNSNLFYLSTLTIDFENLSKKDMIYGQKIDYTNLKTKIKTGYSFKINRDNILTVDVDGVFKYNLSYNHNVAAADSKPYTLNLAYNEIAYYSANYYSIGSDIRWLKNIKKSATELKVSYHYLKPSNVQFTNEYSLINNSNYRHYFEISLNIYF